MLTKSLMRRAQSTVLTKPPILSLKHLPFEMGALEPVISGKLMEFHYSKHHRTYVNNLNKLMEQAHEAALNKDVKASIKIQQALKFNGGGHLNHEFYWDTLCAPVDSCRPETGSRLEQYISHTWGDMDTFQSRFMAVTASVQGSGWGWLAYHKKTNRLKLKVTLNQDQLSDHSTYYVPLLTMDVWEHAYYLDYKNARPVYLQEMWKVVNWQKVAERLDAAIIDSGNKALY